MTDEEKQKDRLKADARYEHAFARGDDEESAEQKEFEVNGMKFHLERADSGRGPSEIRPYQFAKGNKGGGRRIFKEKLTEDERLRYNRERRIVRSIRKTMQDEIDRLQTQWVTALSRGAESVLARAIDEGDPQALSTVWDRVIGRPTTVMEVSSKNDDSIEDVMAKLEALQALALETPAQEEQNAEETDSKDN
jgi:hypothetical protein